MYKNTRIVVFAASLDDIIVLHVDDDTNQLGFTKLFITKNDPKISVDTVSSNLELLQRDLKNMIA